MTKWREMDEPAWQAWLETRPVIVREMATRIRPDRLYRMTSTGQRCYVYSYSEDGTVTVIVDGQFNRVLFGRQVFGISPNDLVECELPGPDEDLGDTAAEAGYTDDDIRNILIPRLREEFPPEARRP